MKRYIIFEHPSVKRTLKEGVEHTELFKAHNIGEPTTIKSIKSSCSCTVPESPKGEIQNSFEIPVKIKLTSTGFFSKSVTIHFSNGEEVVLNINGQVEPNK